MRLCRLLPLIVMLPLAGCSPSSSETTAVKFNMDTSQPVGEEFGEFVIARPVRHANLAIFPILSKKPQQQDRFITLDEGLAAGTVKVMEVGAAESVNVNPAPSTDAPFAGDPFGEERQQTSPIEPTARADENSTGEPRVHANAPSIAANSPPLLAPNVAPQVINESEPPAINEQQRQVYQGELQQLANVDPFGGDRGGEVAGEVNRLMVVNNSDKPLYLMPGEIIYGGKQNRTIGEELVIQPTKKPVAIDAYCVEQGRWAGRSIETTTQHLAQSDGFSTNLSLVVSQSSGTTNLAENSRKGQFIATAGQLNKAARLAVNDKSGQGKVWEEVGKHNAQIGNDAETSDFAAAYLNEDIVNKLKPYVDSLEATGEKKQMVGVAVAIDGKIVTVDMFESTPLFRKFWPKLLKSYAMDAAAAPSQTQGATKPPRATVGDCVAFLNDLQSSQAKTESRADGQKLVRRETKNAVCFSYHHAAESADLAAASPTSADVSNEAQAAQAERMNTSSGGLGGAVHAGGFAK